jgi:hypothetical protein
MVFLPQRGSRIQKLGGGARYALLIGVATAFLSGAISPAFAQVDGGFGPGIAIAPDGGSYIIAASNRQEAVDFGSAPVVEVSFRFNDPDGLNRELLEVKLSYGSRTETVTNVSWSPNSDGTFATAKCKIQPIDAGEHVLTAWIADNTGVRTMRQATFKVTYSDPALPIVSLEPHHDDYRNTTFGASTLIHAIPAICSEYRVDGQR